MGKLAMGKLDKCDVNRFLWYVRLLEDEMNHVASALAREKVRAPSSEDPIRDILVCEEFFEKLEEGVLCVVQRMEFPELLETYREKVGDDGVVSLIWRLKILSQVIAHAYFRPEAVPEAIIRGFVEAAG